MEEKIRVKLGSLQLQDVIQERINKIIDEKMPEIVSNAIFENLGYEMIVKKIDCCIYQKNTKDFMIIVKYFDSKLISWSIALPNGCVSSEVEMSKLNDCVKMVENDLKEFKTEYGKNI